MNWYKKAVTQEEFWDIVDEVSQQPNSPEYQKKVDLEQEIENIDLGFSQYDSDREYRREHEPSENDDDIYKGMFEDYGNALTEVIQEFVVLTKNNPNAKQPWLVASLPRVKKIWEDYMKTGFVRDEKGINHIAEIIIKNIHKLAANTYLMGHTQGNPDEDFEEYGIITEDQKEVFYDYAEAENGQARISDFGLEPLQKEALNLEKTFDPTQKLQIIDRVFNIIHRRSDLPAMFIEGGTSGLDQLFGRPSDEEEEKDPYYASFNLHQYRKAKLVDKIPTDDQEIYLRCMLCKRFWTNDSGVYGGDGVWKTPEEMDMEEKTLMEKLIKSESVDIDFSKPNPLPRAGISDGLCPVCKKEYMRQADEL